MFGKRKFYSLKEILKKGATYNIIMGERSNGKTYAALSYAIEQYFKTGKQAVLIRRWQTDIAGHRGSQMFAAFTSDFIKKVSGGQYDAIRYYSGKFYFGNYVADMDKIIYSDKGLFCFL